ncbi:J domain-containing protein [Halobacteriales archaeon Cl-PHB]
MTVEAFTALPTSLLVGLAIGLLGTGLVASIFLLADRLLPDRPLERAPRTGESRRRAEFRAYLQAIDEPFAEDHFVEGQHVAFYLPQRDVAITFDARAYYRIARSSTTPVLVEHEMPGSVLGARLPFDVPEIDFGPTGADRQDPTVAAFRELGVPADATLREIKRAYRRRVKEVHPDQGGSEDAFRRLREAYTTATAHATT